LLALSLLERDREKEREKRGEGEEEKRESRIEDSLSQRLNAWAFGFVSLEP